jgi:hypothetical protein
MRQQVTEIVGILIQGKIMSGIDALRAVKYLGDYEQLICRDRAKFMAAADVGHNWDRLANARTLFLLDDKGEPQWPI